MAAPLPENEEARLRALKQLHLLDTPAESEFDQLVELAALACDTPKAFVTLIDQSRQWLKAAYGDERGETARSEAFCAHTILHKEGVILVPDARLDERFANNPRVVEDGIRFYAGVPLTLPTGETMGALCVVANEPKQLNEQQQRLLVGLGNLANEALAKRLRRNTRAGYSHQSLPISEAEHLALISRFTSNGVLLTDANNTILWMNDGSARITGYTPDEVIGKTPRLFRSPNSDPATLDKIRRQLQLHEPVQCELMNRSKSGQDYWVNLEIQPIFDEHGSLQGYIGFQSDITERKLNDQLKSEFIATVSHELRTPLTSINGAIRLLTSGEVVSLPLEAQSLLRIAEKNGARLANLIDDLLDMEKLLSQGMDFDIKPCPLGAILRESVEENGPFLQQHLVTVEWPKNLPAELTPLADRHRLKQILTNFLSNAAKFSPANCVVHLEVKSNGDQVQIRVCDQGPGIPETFRSRLFEKFAQADGSNTRKKGGTGLGLAICKALAEQMNGSVDYEPGPNGVGSVFLVNLPKA